MQKAKVIYISQEILPYNTESVVSKATRYLPEYIKTNTDKDVRLFMPKYGMINERRYQLHEVIRLAGMNVVISDIDYPLVIKVASVPEAKMQSYFMDNEELFGRKGVIGDESTPFFEDNDARMIFFCQSVIETINKLGWIPDVIHCHGWMTTLIPAYIKKNFADEPVFKNTKIITSIYPDTELKGELNNELAQKSEWNNLSTSELSSINTPNWENLSKFAAQWSDGVILSAESNVLEDFLSTNNRLFIKEVSNENYAVVNEFYDAVLAYEAVSI